MGGGSGQWVTEDTLFNLTPFPKTNRVSIFDSDKQEASKISLRFNERWMTKSAVVYLGFGCAKAQT